MSCHFKCVTMKSLVLPVLFVAVWIGAQAQESGFYDSRYDYLDIDAILDNKRLVKNYIDCLLNEKPCSPEGKALKRMLPEGLRTKCARCTPRQKHNALAVVRRLKSEHPAEWKRLAARWDPTGDLTRRFEDYLEKDDNNRIGYEKPIEPQRPVQAQKPVQSQKPVPPPKPIQPQKPVQAVQPIRPLPQNPTLNNRFAPVDEEQPSSSEMRPTIRSVPSSSMRMPTDSAPTTEFISTSTFQTSTKFNEVPTTTFKAPTRHRIKTNPTRRPEFTLPPPIKVDLTPIYAGTMGLIDHFGNKIIRTTELVTDLLRNTVRVVAGAKY